MQAGGWCCPVKLGDHRMANLWSVRIDTAAFERNLQRVRHTMEQDAAKEAEKVARSYERHLRRNTPKSDDAPHIVDTIDVRRGSTPLEWIVSIGSSTLDYIWALEYGHALNGKHIPGKKFVRPLKVVYNKRFARAMRRVARRAFARFNQ